MGFGRQGRPIDFRSIYLIYNPTSGRLQGQLNHLLPEVLGILEGSGVVVTRAPTTRPGDAVELAREAVRSAADLVVVAGGDGTVNEAVNGLVNSRVPLAVLPFGTANVLGTELGLGRKPLLVARRLGEMRAERVSVGLLTSRDASPRYFLLMAGIGLDAHIVSRVDLSLKKQVGKLAYWLSGFSQLGSRFPQFGVRSNGTAHKSGFTLASRVRNYGGNLEIARTACLLDDYFELRLVRGREVFSVSEISNGCLNQFPP